MMSMMILFSFLINSCRRALGEQTNDPGQWEAVVALVLLAGVLVCLAHCDGDTETVVVGDYAVNFGGPCAQ